MKTLFSRFFLLAVVIVTVAACCATAQTQTNTIMFTSPGPFVAGETTFPSGTYTLTQSPDDLSVWEISSDSKSASALMLTEMADVAAPTKNELTFHKYGSTLVLKQIWIAGSSTSYIVQTGYVERKAAKAGKPTMVAVPAQKK